jgi:hypothetical protein
MNKIVNSFFFSLFIFVHAFADNAQALENQITQSPQDAYQQLLNCTLEDRLLAACFIVVSNHPEVETEVALEEGDFQRVIDLFNVVKPIKKNKFAILIQQLSHDEQLRLFAHWIADEIKQPKNVSLTKQSLLMLMDRAGDFCLENICDQYFSNKPTVDVDEDTNRYIDPTYYDALLNKIKGLPELEKINFSMLLCEPFFIYIVFALVKALDKAFFGVEESDNTSSSEKAETTEFHSDRKNDYAFNDWLSLNEFSQLLTTIDDSINFSPNCSGDMFFYPSLQNKLTLEDLKNPNIACLVKAVESKFYEEKLEFTNNKDQFDSKEHLLKEFKNLPKQDQLELLMTYFYAMTCMRLLSLYSNALETI